MAKEKQNKIQSQAGFRVQFNFLGLMIFSAALILAAGAISFALVRPTGKSAGSTSLSEEMQSDQPEDRPPAQVQPWGELMAYDTQLERPQEYMALEIADIKTPAWTFSKLKPEQVRKLMLKCGMSAAQTDRALAPQSVFVSDTGTVVKPDRESIFSLTPDVRSRLYSELAKEPANHYMRFPFCFPGRMFEEIVSGDQIPAAYVSRIRSLLYRIGDSQYFSDFEAVMQQVPAEKERLQLVQALSSQSAVMVRVRIRPQTEIDKLLAYWAWAPGVRFTNLRPLLESLKRMENGSSISLLYFLPPFARERLYTYPRPAQANEPVMDCHWSSLNFFNQTPDARFSDPEYASSYVAAHYYEVARPSRYGDLIFLLDESGNAVHSAVYIADDIVFTKNGNNYMTPWMLMRLKNLQATYSVTGTTRLVVYRSKDI